MAKKKFDTEVSLKVTGDSKKLKEDLKKTEQQAKKTSQNLKSSLGGALKSLGNFKLPSLGLGGLLAGGLAVLGIKDTIDELLSFEDAIQGVFNRSTNVTDAFKKKMKDDIFAMSTDLNVSAQNIANYVYKSLEYGIPESDILEFTREAVEASKLLRTDANEIIQTSGRVYLAYGDSVGTPTEIIQKLQLATKNATGSFSEFVSGLDELVPKAARYGVAFEDVIGLYSQFNKQGFTASDSQSLLVNLFERLSETTGDFSEVLNVTLGKSFKDFIKEGGSVGDVLNRVVAYIKRNNLSPDEVFGGGEQWAAIQALMAENYKFAQKSVEDFGNASELANEQQEEGLNAATESVNGVKTAFDNLRIQVLEEIAPELIPFLTGIKDKLVEITPKLIDMTGLLIDALGGDAAAQDEIKRNFESLMTYVGEVIIPIAEEIGASILTGMFSPVKDAFDEFVGAYGETVLTAVMPGLSSVLKLNEDIAGVRSNYEIGQNQKMYDVRTALKESGLMLPISDVKYLMERFAKPGGINTNVRVDIGMDDTQDRLSVNQVDLIVNTIRRELLK